MIVIIPVVLAGMSPQLQWRRAPYIIAGFAGVLAMGLLLLQPLAILGYLPGFSALESRRFHRLIGMKILLAIIIHVGGLWITSPPDVIDALTFSSPTPFSVWGVLAMWAVLLTALLAMLRKPLRLRPKTWRNLHLVMAAVIITGTIVHALLIEGTMETNSKIVLSILLGIGFAMTLLSVFKPKAK